MANVRPTGKRNVGYLITVVLLMAVLAGAGWPAAPRAVAAAQVRSDDTQVRSDRTQARSDDTQVRPDRTQARPDGTQVQSDRRQVPPDRTRAHAWTWAAGAFQQQQEGYLSPPGRAPFPFTAAGVYLQPGGADGVFPVVELRLRADGAEWSPWYGVGDLEPQADGRAYGENLVAWLQAREVQVRVRAQGPLEAGMQELTVVAIDASDGPTTDQAARAAQVRTEAAAAAAAPGVPQPRVIRRGEWGADESLLDWDPEYAPVDKLVVHHTVNGGGGDPAAEVRSIYYFHAVTRGWGDIGYQFLVDRWGNIFEGRYGGPDVIGAHVFHWNAGSMGVSVLGCYDAEECDPPQLPTAATLAALADLNAWAASRRALDPRRLREFTNEDGTLTNYVLAGHRDYSPTVCPGGSLYAALPGLREAVWARLPQYDARFGWHDTPPSLEAGAQVAVHPNLYNHGRLTWSDGAGVRLGYRWLKEGQVVAENTAAARILPQAVVNVGEMTALVAGVTAPITPGSYTLRWDLYHEGSGWFADQPAPAGRSQPLELNVEVTPAHYLDVRLEPSAAEAGDRLRVEVTMRGLVGYGFEARTRLPAEVTYLSDSGQGDFGSITFASGQVVWSGTLGARTARASFEVLISEQLGDPQALSVTTTLNIPGHPLLELERRFVVNGLESYFPLVGKSRVD